MTVLDFYKVVPDNANVIIRLESEVKYSGLIKDIPISLFDIIISEICISVTRPDTFLVYL